MTRRPALLLALIVLALPACRRTLAQTWLTYFNGDWGLSVRYPASWKTEVDQAEPGGMWFRHFLAPPAAGEKKATLTVTLMAGPLTGTVDAYAQASYLAGQTPSATKDEVRGQARGKSWAFAAGDKAQRLILVQEGPRVYGLHAQGSAAALTDQGKTLDAMFESLTLERPAEYPEVRNDKYGFSIHVPASWRSTRTFAGGESFLQQFQSPPVGAEKGGETVHGSISITVEPVKGDIEAFHEAAKLKLGEAFRIHTHVPFNGGYVDTLSTETPVSISRSKRYYRVANGRGYTVTLEARDDVYHRLARWYDVIAATLKVGPEVGKP